MLIRPSDILAFSVNPAVFISDRPLGCMASAKPSTSPSTPNPSHTRLQPEVPDAT